MCLEMVCNYILKLSKNIVQVCLVNRVKGDVYTVYTIVYRRGSIWRITGVLQNGL